jgi:hypothetical protein
MYFILHPEYTTPTLAISKFVDIDTPCEFCRRQEILSLAQVNIISFPVFSHFLNISQLPKSSPVKSSFLSSSIHHTLTQSGE